MSQPPALTVNGVSKRFGDVVAVESAALTLEGGAVTCLLGPSGCGKSTLLRMIAGLERADSGAISAGDRRLSGDGVHVGPEDRGIGLVFQDFALFPHLDVARNVGFGLRRLDAKTRAARVNALLDRFRIAPLARAYPHSLSGGEQQRAAIARALAREPAVVLMDEPFSGIDGALKRDIQADILGALRASGAAVLIVTHDPEDAMRNGDRIVLMNGGRILQEGPPETCYRRPVSLAAARMLGPVNAVPGTVSAGVLQGPLGPHPAPGTPDGPALLLVRPEAVTVTPGDGPAAGRGSVLSCAFVGGRYEASVTAGGQTLLVHLSEPLEPGGSDGLCTVRITAGQVVSV